MDSVDIAMALTFVVIASTVVLYAVERYAIETIALGSVSAFIVIFSVFPVERPDGSLITTGDFLSGFSNPALITVICLLIIGQGLFQTDALEAPAKAIVKMTRGRSLRAAIPVLLTVAALSAFLNNTPVVVMFLPILTAVAATVGQSPARVLMPLSFLAILGGMTTLIGSSTNLLVANFAAQSSDLKLTFFSFTPIGLIIAGVGSIYVLFIMPKLLPVRKTMAEEFQSSSGKQFIAQIEITYGHPLVGVESVSGMFPQLKDMTVRLVQRGQKPILPPFENVVLSPGDTVIVAATRAALANALARRQPLMEADSDTSNSGRETQAPAGTISLAEVVVAPASRLMGRTLPQSGFYTDTGCLVMGIQRRSRMPRMAMNDIRLEAGDVLLVAGSEEAIARLRGNRDVLLLDWSMAEVPRKRYAPRALVIFALVVALAASGLVPIVTTAVAGTFAMIVSGCLNIRQAMRAIDSRIFMLVGASLAAAVALEGTGGANAIATGLVHLLAGASPTVMLSALFFIVMILTNFLSNNAAAVLFTPIAINLANQIGASPEAFVVCLIIAANSSFATPIGYQTNLIVMGPGHYKFNDFVRAGTPLALILWLTFSLVAPWYYGL
ncbi:MULTISPECIES: SLC13 family permease [Stappiaceae]|jgi:di/tricarboxylate transporter|uniref:SLC13 family permease n=1 Tax=Stappiaceae TaxID=2821832 RepID=UPI00126909EF|nr:MULTISPECIES: SLC13 family permease [Stappiaceae]MBN8180503.1 SLC13 family permease [Roseibium aggregatum]QFT00626.1 potassium transporter peripheral membrane component [Labrenzia sp. THAF191b]QFT06939.1 potassium transporter peripheral membrane component [Labrenzia sp. THAF191a]QFT18483.1 potassium transporter peripheral membrane component [Labrenzia sp. THAF187b]UES45377.1 TRAP transporter large permease subunit [Roseibium aggregatum]